MKNIFFNEDVLNAEKKIMSSLKISSLVLMENAGANSADYIANNIYPSFENEIIILTGKGNNGGDGFVIARHLINKNIPVRLLMLFSSDELKGDAKTNFEILKNLVDHEDIDISYCKDSHVLSKALTDFKGILVDAIFGVGFTGELNTRIAHSFQIINDVKDGYKISIDTPSGLSHYSQSSECLDADLTLTMGVKKFHTMFYEGKKKSGTQEVINIGISDNEFTKVNLNKIFETEASDVSSFIPKRSIDSHKYQNGKLFVLTGSPGLTGAAYLCCSAAMRIGCGAVIAGVPESVNEILEVKLTEVMTFPLRETAEKTLALSSYEQLTEKFSWADAVLIGPGLTKNEETLELVRKIVSENDLTFIIDADAIRAFKGNLNLLKNKKIILTPHFGEFAGLLGITTDELKDNFYFISKEFSEKYGVLLVLKNAPSIITNGKEFYINSTGKENLATAGTGDILSGIISGFCSQTNDLLNSAIAGVYIHGRCGDILYEKTGSSSTTAGDLLNEIALVKNSLSLC